MNIFLVPVPYYINVAKSIDITSLFEVSVVERNNELKK